MSLARFGVRNPVVANLVMFAIIGAGLIFGISLRREFFPQVDATEVIVSAPYPGAAPDEVERALAVKIEDRLADLDDLKEISSTVSEGAATVRLEFEDGVDIDEKVADVKREIDALEDLPDAADRVIVRKLEPNLPAIALSLYGDADERVMKDFILAIRDDLESLPGMGDVVVSGVRRDEIVVEPRPAALVKHALSVDELADRIRAAMIERPGGSVRTDTGTITVRTMGIDERAAAVRDIVVRGLPGGRVVRLGDIAEVREGFVDQDLRVRLDGLPAASITVFKTGDEDIIRMAEMVKAYVAGRNGEPLRLTTGEALSRKIQRSMLDAQARKGKAVPEVPPPVSDRVRAWRLGHEGWLDGPPPANLKTTTDLARFVVGRLDLLTRNALFGGLLVFATLMLLLNWRVAFWVAAGLVISILGTLAVMHFAGVTLNLLTMFGLIIVLGILVDDAIVVAENITARHERGEPAMVAAVLGTQQVGWPVVATVLTTVCAFLPLALIEGTIGDFLGVLPVVVGCALLVSLLESLFILPSHMAHSLKSIDAHKQGRHNRLWALESRFERGRVFFFDRLVRPAYMRLLALALHYRYIATATAVALVLIAVGMARYGKPGFVFFESDDAETVNATITMPIGTPTARTDDLVRRVEAAALAQPEVASAYAQSGAIGDINGEGNDASAGHLGQIILELHPVEQRDRTSVEVIQAIRDQVGELPGVKSFRMEGVSGGPGGQDITYTVVGHDAATVDRVVERAEALLAEYDGVIGIANDADRGLRELRIDLRPGATELGFTRSALGRQIQAAAFGLEAWTFAGNREDVDVRVLLPESVRRSVHEIESMFVVSPAGRAVPLAEVAELTETTGYATIRRLDRMRAVTITADVVDSITDPETVTGSLAPRLEALAAQYPGVRITERGRQQDVTDSFATLPVGMAVAAGLIFVCLAWLFGSFTQPLVVMTAIPFAVIGMIGGHLVLGYNMTFLSLIGFVALAGIVVNDSLIFMEFFNEKRREGASVRDACLAAGRERVRAIILTTVTTVLGLLPLMLEQSFQARFLIPMAITISFGLISATVLILVVLPCLLMILDDLVHAARVLWFGDPAIERRNPFLQDPELALLHRAERDARERD